jgi:hypothetical protein
VLAILVLLRKNRAKVVNNQVVILRDAKSEMLLIRVKKQENALFFHRKSIFESIF